MTVLGIYAWLVVACGGYAFLFSLANWIYFRSITREKKRRQGPLVSLLIPARNEADRIAPTLDGLAHQDYENLEVLVLDDNSDDGTWEILKDAEATNQRLKALKGRDLPEGWKGKPYAMEQLSQEARGEILIFIDADMKPDPGFVSWTVENLEHHGVDFLSGYPRHTTPALLEYALFPVMYLATTFLLPLWLFRRSRTYMFSHAIGQYFCVRAGVLKQAGGFAAVKNKINEDIQMARHLKGLGFRQIFLDAKNHIEGNMYDSMDHAKMGVMRVVYEYFDNQIHPFIFMGLVMLSLVILPPWLLLPLWLTASSWAVIFTLGVALMLAGWMVTLYDRRMPWFVPLLYPIQYSWVVILSLRSIGLSRRGKGYLWKGRIVR